MKSRLILITIALLYALVIMISSVLAHANLARSSPAANSVNLSPPDEIRLWFTEPLEPQFSSITLRNLEDDKISIPDATVDSSDTKQLFVSLDPLPDGIYTVSWSVVSTADGHRTAGSFGFVVGEASGPIPVANEVDTPIPEMDTIVRWFNLLAMALWVGGAAFLSLIWLPVDDQVDNGIDVRPGVLGVLVWVLVGVGGALILLLQASIVADASLFSDNTRAAIQSVATQTRFGDLWIVRNVIWMGTAVIWYMQNNLRTRSATALIAALMMLALHSLNSHANGVQDPTVATLLDWLHLSGASLWIGGLATFLVVAVLVIRVQVEKRAEILALLTGRFSIYARLWVMVLIVTGIYAAWLQVGSVSGLTDTKYGQALLIKVGLIIPLLGIAGINLLRTHRELEAGNTQWAKPLAGLLGVELALTIGILVLVGGMLSIEPARNEIARVKANQPDPPDPQPLTETIQAKSMTIDLEMSPGWAGENTYSLRLSTGDGQPITNASLIRLRFRNDEAGIEESEINPVHTNNGVYVAEGSNVGVPGTWRIRATIQRPGEFDTVIDFEPTVPSPPPPPVPQPIDASIPIDDRQVALILSGLALLAIGGWTLGRELPNIQRSLMPATLVLAGLAVGIFAVTMHSESSVETYQIAQILLLQDSNFPYLITDNGQLLRPTSEGAWRVMSLDAIIKDAYIANDGSLWVATNQGTYKYVDGSWQQVQAAASTTLVSTQGYLYIFGDGPILRGDPENWRELSPPNGPSTDTDFVMMPDYSYLLRSGNNLYRSPDLGLNWEPLIAPPSVRHLFTDMDDQVWAVAKDGIYLWQSDHWNRRYALPDNRMPTAITFAQEDLFTVAAGQLYKTVEQEWQQVAFSPSPQTVLDVNAQRGGTLWVLTSDHLWRQLGSGAWLSFEIAIK